MGSLPVDMSGSRASALLNLNDFKSPFESWLEIMEGREPGFCQASGYDFEPFEGNAATVLGNAFEDAVCQLLREIHDDQIVDRERAFVHKLHDFVTCHIDGIFQSGPMFEGKTTSDFTFRNKWGEPGTDRIPRDNQVQVQHNLALTGLKSAIVSVLVFPKRQADLIDLAEFNEKTCLNWARVLNEMGYFHEYRIEANESLQKSILEMEVDFWNVNVLGRTPPEPNTYDDLKAVIKAPKGTIIATDEIESFAREYKALTGEMGEAKKRKAQLKTLVLKFMRLQADVPIDDESVEKWILKDDSGHNLASFDGKTYR